MERGSEKADLEKPLLGMDREEYGRSKMASTSNLESI